MQQPREATHELVILRKPKEDAPNHKNSASSMDGNYTQLKTIRGPVGNYPQVSMQQILQH